MTNAQYNWLNHYTPMCDINQLLQLAGQAYVRLNQPSCFEMVEVGCWVGYTTTWLAHPFDKYHVVDNFSGGYDRLNPIALSVGGPDAVRTIFWQNIQAAGLLDKVLLEEKDSALAAEEWVKHTMHMVFIDAGHEYRDEIRNMKAWLPVVVPNGTICGHDIHMKGVRRAVKEMFGTYNESGNVWWVIKSV